MSISLRHRTTWEHYYEMATKPAEEAPQMLKYQTWVFKVFIHCEGCKKKVRKILKDIEGVYATDVDSQQHKVTVTGNVDAQTLIKKLAKSGKYAEPWPEKPAEKKEKKPAKSKNNNDKPTETKDNNAGKVSGEGPKKGQSQKADNAAEGDGGSSPEEGDIKGGGETEKAIPASGGGGKKKKKKGGQNGNSGGSAENVVDGGGVTGSRVASVIEAVPPPIGSMNLGPPSLGHHHDFYPYPPAPAMNYHYAPPMYGMSYNTAYPSPATASSYYAPPHMHAFSSYSNPPGTGSYYLPPPSDPFYTFHDNDRHHDPPAAACYIM